MKVLFINGEWDTQTARIVENEIGIEKFAKQVEDAGRYLVMDDDDLHIYGDAKIIKFGEVDKDFVQFLNTYFWDEYRAYDKEWHVIEE